MQISIVQCLDMWDLIVLHFEVKFEWLTNHSVWLICCNVTFGLLKRECGDGVGVAAVVVEIASVVFLSLFT